MDVGVGLPTAVPGVDPVTVVEWARRADDGPFASLGTVDRIVYDNFEPLVSLAAAAAVTSRVELVTCILIAPLRERSTMAKQLISLDALSGGRLTLGVAIGARGDDYEHNELFAGRSDQPIGGAASVVAAGQPRGDRLTDQLTALRALWDDGRITPSGAPRRAPRILVGGASGPAFARMARLSDGYVHGGGPPRAFASAATQARAAWADAGRPGEPQLWGQGYYALGGDADAEAGRDYLLDYYAFTGAFAHRIADGLLTTPLEVRAFVEGYADAGCDHVILLPATGDLDQLDRLADVLDR
jgi:alkanesulfonate monooxygenase SsuD/methylene tetrahydromethanopterin reductase-like flavin-dependent oxidoreductase (luciferase family)